MRGELTAFVGGLALALIGGAGFYGLTGRSEPPAEELSDSGVMRTVAVWPVGGAIAADAVDVDAWFAEQGAAGVATMVALYDAGVAAEMSARCLEPRDPTLLCDVVLTVGVEPASVAVAVPEAADPVCAAAAECVARVRFERPIPPPPGARPAALTLKLQLQPVERDPDVLRRLLIVLREDVAAARAGGMFGAGDPAADFAVLREEGMIADLERRMEGRP